MENQSEKKRVFSLKSIKKYVNRGNFRLVLQSAKSEGLICTFSKIKKTLIKNKNSSEKILEFKPVDSRTVIFGYYDYPKITYVFYGFAADDVSALGKIESSLRDAPIEIFVIKPALGFIVSDFVKGVKIIDGGSISDCVSQVVSVSRGGKYIFTTVKNLENDAIIESVRKSIDSGDTIVLSDAGVAESKTGLTMKEICGYCEEGKTVSVGREQLSY